MNRWTGELRSSPPSDARAVDRVLEGKLSRVADESAARVGARVARALSLRLTNALKLTDKA